MKYFLTLISFVSLSAQSVEKSVISAIGNSYSGQNFSVSYNAGELLIGSQASEDGSMQLGSAFNDFIHNWDTSNVINMSGMFYDNIDFNKPIGNWDVSNVTNMSKMFNCYPSRNNDGGNFNQPIGNWDTSNETNMSEMFYYQEEFNQNISDWNTQNVVNMGNMFNNAKLFNQDLSSWNVDKVTSYGCFDCSASRWVLPKPNFN